MVDAYICIANHTIFIKKKRFSNLNLCCLKINYEKTRKLLCKNTSILIYTKSSEDHTSILAFRFISSQGYACKPYLLFGTRHFFLVGDCWYTWWYLVVKDYTYNAFYTQKSQNFWCYHQTMKKSRFIKHVIQIGGLKVPR